MDREELAEAGRGRRGAARLRARHDLAHLDVVERDCVSSGLRSMNSAAPFAASSDSNTIIDMPLSSPALVQ